MSSRDEGDIWPFERDPVGLYDLEQPAELTGIASTSSRCAPSAISSFELWDRFSTPWQDNPYNPKNNRKTAEESGLCRRPSLSLSTSRTGIHPPHLIRIKESGLPTCSTAWTTRPMKRPDHRDVGSSSIQSPGTIQLLHRKTTIAPPTSIGKTRNS